MYFALPEETKNNMTWDEACNCFLGSLLADEEKRYFSDKEIGYIGSILVCAAFDPD